MFAATLFFASYNEENAYPANGCDLGEVILKLY